jgi:hypothetical protein
LARAISTASALPALLHALLRDREVASTVMCGKRLNCWKTMPIRERTAVEVGVGIGDVDALDQDLPGGGLLEPVDAAQQGRLARAGGTDHADHLAVVDVEVDALEHLVVAEALVQVADLDGTGA